jgi:hypothetical protein
MQDFATVRRAATALITAGLTAAGLVALAAPAQAQAWAYPAFQQSHVVDREFNFAVATADNGGTSFLAQWREGVVPGKQQFSIDAGLATVSGDVIGFFGGTYAVQFISETAQQPLELLGALGANVAFGSGGTLFRVPVSVSLGHRFPLQGDLAITPYVHPDIALAVCSDCGARGRGDANVDIGIGFGVNFEVTHQVALRLDTSFGSSSFGSSDATVGFGVAWSPMGLRKPPQ